jgi:hypothetical protein
MSEKKSKRKAKPRQGYTAKSPALCMVVHDLGGRPVNDKVSSEILDLVTQQAIKYGYVVNVTNQ